jgi:hypothetical protein
MRWRFRRAARLVAPIGLTLLLGASAYAYMASNTVSPSSAGVGVGVITGYRVSGITYDLSQAAGDPDNLLNVAFMLTPASGNLPATSVAVWFDNDMRDVASTRLGTCTEIGWPTRRGISYWTCSLNLWSQDAGPAPWSTHLHVAAVHGPPHWGI